MAILKRPFVFLKFFLLLCVFVVLIGGGFASFSPWTTPRWPKLTIEFSIKSTICYNCWDSVGSSTIQNDLQVFDQGYGLLAPPSFQVINPEGKPQLPQSRKSLQVVHACFYARPDREEREQELRGYTAAKSD